MKVVVLHGQNHKGSTYHVTQAILEQMKVTDENVKAFYFKEQKHCMGCYNCFIKGEQQCPHQQQITPVVNALEEADVIIIETPCYCLGISGQLKSFLDHLAYMWMVHRPRKSMFTKVGIVVSTTAGAGAGKVTKDLAQQLFYWGVPKVYKVSFALGAASWQEVSDKNKEKINKKAHKLAQAVTRRVGKVKPGLKTQGMFLICRMMHQNNAGIEKDTQYWKDAGWTEDKRPWKK